MVSCRILGLIPMNSSMSIAYWCMGNLPFSVARKRIVYDVTIRKVKEYSSPIYDLLNRAIATRELRLGIMAQAIIKGTRQNIADGHFLDS